MRMNIEITVTKDDCLFHAVLDSDGYYLSSDEATLSACLEELATQAATIEADEIRAHVSQDSGLEGFSQVTFRR